ncbi:hypothetical protein JTE90_004427 [Oedothorax gibbosus]|uniref:Uncharacterized protein n=1 Tax=Oedothorax gibbosus TaxID=931172 RepID=A0AAV6TLA9_9ARAC|nr:hypothetical protein JTE90_004427 [Oedothorax gibbosus]
MDYFTKWPEAYVIPNQEATPGLPRPCCGIGSAGSECHSCCTPNKERTSPPPFFYRTHRPARGNENSYNSPASAVRWNGRKTEQTILNHLSLFPSSQSE